MGSFTWLIRSCYPIKRRRTWLGAPEGAPSFAKAINFAWKRSNSRGTLVCSGTMVCTVASHPVVDWTEDERSWFVLVDRIADTHSLSSTTLPTVVYGLALRILGDSSSAEDIMHEVYLQIWHTAESYDQSLGN